jgi:F0F1-type ATP synthase epsilon subunit
MFFSIATPEYTGIKPNSLKVRAALTSGLLEIYDKHQDLIGKINNNFLQVEYLIDNKLENSYYILQDAILVVSNQGFEDNNQTSIFVYAKRLIEISKTFSFEDLAKDTDQVNKNLEKEMESLRVETDENNSDLLATKILLLKEEILFLEKAYTLGRSILKN